MGSGPSHVHAACFSGPDLLLAPPAQRDPHPNLGLLQDPLAAPRGDQVLARADLGRRRLFRLFRLLLLLLLLLLCHHGELLGGEVGEADAFL